MPSGEKVPGAYWMGGPGGTRSRPGRSGLEKNVIPCRESNRCLVVGGVVTVLTELLGFRAALIAV